MKKVDKYLYYPAFGICGHPATEVCPTLEVSDIDGNYFAFRSSYSL